jgi:hypothetical protein
MGQPMKSAEMLKRLGRVPKLTRTRIVLALMIAVMADGLQWLLGPIGWVIGDQLIDVAAMLFVGWLVGFHWLLLPSFLLELFPVVDELPTWTACTIAVIALRRRRQNSPPDGNRQIRLDA